MNIAFFGANAIFRKTRFASSPLGPDRVEINYKDSLEDPLYGINNALVTGNWPSPPDADPESSLTGQAYACATPVRRPGVIVQRRQRVLVQQRHAYRPGQLPRGGDQRQRRDRGRAHHRQRRHHARPQHPDPCRIAVQIQNATAINNNGQIVANATYTPTGQTHALLLTPG